MYGRTRRRRRSSRYNRRTRKTLKRSGNYGRKTGRKTRAFRPKWIKAVSQTNRVKFDYGDTDFSVTLTALNNYIGYYVFRGNSPYDPDYQGVGVQPYGFDNWVTGTMYQSFVCPSSSIKVYFRLGEQSDVLRRLHAIVFPFRIANPSGTDISDVRMIPFHKETVYDSLTEGTRGAIMSCYNSTRRIFSEMRDHSGPTFLGTYAANPSTEWYWIVYFAASGYDSEDIDIYFDVKIRYYAKLGRFLEPNES